MPDQIDQTQFGGVTVPTLAIKGRISFATLPARQGQRATFTRKSPVSAGVHQLKRSDRQGERVFHNLLEL
jgi:hypothetical protein